MPLNKSLKLQAVDEADLIVISSALQDGIAPVGEIKFDSTARTLTLLINRFRWELSDYGKGARVPSALRIDGVLGVKARGISRSNPDSLAVLLSVEFVADDEPPGGHLHLKFAGNGELDLTVEVLDIILTDIGQSRGTKSIPEHFQDGADT